MVSKNFLKIKLALILVTMLFFIFLFSSCNLNSSDLSENEIFTKLKEITLKIEMEKELPEVNGIFLNLNLRNHLRNPLESDYGKHNERIYAINGGRGFLVDSSGLVATAEHIVGNSFNLIIDNVKSDADILKTNRNTDLAILKINTYKNSFFEYFSFNKKTEIGEFAFFLDNESHLAKAEIISKDQEIEVQDPWNSEERSLKGLIAINAVPNPGLSGSPLLDQKGDIIGMIIAIDEIEQKIFALPANEIEKLLQQF